MDSPDIDIDAVLASYNPLSSLPTPPPSHEHKKDHLLDTYRAPSSECPPAYTPPYTGHATYLCTVLPSNVHHLLSVSSTPTLPAHLERADLPQPVLGLAACILESLSNRFARSWKQALFYTKGTKTRAETVIIAALSIASGFLDDTAHSTRWWSEDITFGEISLKEINVAVRCALVDIDYDIHSFTEKMVFDAVAEMRRGGTSRTGKEDTSAEKAGAWVEPASQPGDDDKDSRRDSGYGGNAVWDEGVVTPEPTPPLEQTPFLRLL